MLLRKIHSFFLFCRFKMQKRIKIYGRVRFYGKISINVEKGAFLTIGNGSCLSSGCIINVRKNGGVIIGAGCFLNYNCILTSREKITVDDGTIIGPNCSFFDHDHLFSSTGVKANGFISGPIHIGKNCWIGANTIVLKGSDIGDDCVVGAGSIVKGTIPSRTIAKSDRSLSIKKIQ